MLDLRKTESQNKSESSNVSVRVKTKSVKKPPRDVFERLGCGGVSYEFTADAESFDLTRFRKAIGGVGGGEWIGTCSTKDKASGYHIHFKGSATSKRAVLTIQYYRGSLTPRADEEEPFAESFMVWVGSFFATKTSEAKVLAWFEKPRQQWRGRFNLPFKVTMAGSGVEVAIDGISLALPKNDWGAERGWLSKIKDDFSASVQLKRRVHFSRFSIESEVMIFNEAIKIYVEEIGPS